MVSKWWFTWDQRFLCLILDLSFKWQIILFFPGRIHTSLPPYGVGYFLGGRSRMLVRCTSEAASSMVSTKHFTKRFTWESSALWSDTSNASSMNIWAEKNKWICIIQIINNGEICYIVLFPNILQVRTTSPNIFTWCEVPQNLFLFLFVKFNLPVESIVCY